MLSGFDIVDIGKRHDHPVDRIAGGAERHDLFEHPDPVTGTNFFFYRFCRIQNLAKVGQHGFLSFELIGDVVDLPTDILGQQPENLTQCGIIFSDA